MNRVAATLLAVLIASSAAAAQAADVARQIPVDSNFSEGKIGFTEGGQGMTFRVDLIESGGQLELCGAVIYHDAQLRRQSKMFLRDSALTINGRKVLKDLSFRTPLVGQTVTFNGAMATCKSIGVSAKAKIESLDVASSRRTCQF